MLNKRLFDPGSWLRNKIGDALNGFFREPYLLWFVAEDPVRNNHLPGNIDSIAKTIIDRLKFLHTTSMQEQLDYGIRLVAWSAVAKRCGVQEKLLKVFVEAGASTTGVSDDVNGNMEAAKYLTSMNANISLATALCIDKWELVPSLALTASQEEKQFALTLCALNGRKNGIESLIPYGVMLNEPSSKLYSHATALHHAVWSGSFETVKLLVEAGADLNIKDSIYEGTPLDWAEYGKKKDIAEYLKGRKK